MQESASNPPHFASNPLHFQEDQMNHFICPECVANKRKSDNDYCNSKLTEAHLPQAHATHRPLSHVVDARCIGEVAPAEEAVEGGG